MAERTLRVCALYPDLMNIYADRGNITVFERRCTWRGIGFELAGAGIGDAIDPDAHDLFYIGGGQDRDQALCARDLATVKRDALHAAAARGAVVFAVCGGLQLLGHGYDLADERLPGVGLVDLDTRREEGPRLLGNIAIALDLPGGPRRLAGFENHAGRTYLGAGTEPLGRVLKGNGNNGSDGTEGVRGGPHGTVVGTYMHGPLLPKNTAFADWLTATALGLAPGGLDAARRRAGGRGARRGGARRGALDRDGGGRGGAGAREQPRRDADAHALLGPARDGGGEQAGGGAGDVGHPPLHARERRRHDARDRMPVVARDREIARDLQPARGRRGVDAAGDRVREAEDGGRPRVALEQRRRDLGGPLDRVRRVHDRDLQARARR